MSGETKRSRRRFFRDAVVTMATAKFGIVGSAHAQTSTPTPIRAGHTSFGALKRIDAGLVNIGLRGSRLCLHRDPSSRTNHLALVAFLGGTLPASLDFS